MAEGGGLLNRCRAFKVLPRVRIPPSPPSAAARVRSQAGYGGMSRRSAKLRRRTDLRTFLHSLSETVTSFGVPHRVLARLLQQLGDERGPAGLVAGAKAAAGVAVEVFVERDVVAPVRIRGRTSSTPPLTGRFPSASRRNRALNLRDNSADTSRSVRCRPGAGRALHTEIAAEVVMELLQ